MRVQSEEEAADVIGVSRMSAARCILRPFLSPSLPALQEAENDLIIRGAAYVRRITLAQMKQPQTIRHDLKGFDASQLSGESSRPGSAQSDKKAEPMQISEAELKAARQEPYRTQHYLKQGGGARHSTPAVWKHI
jgi:hypothetical protein